MNFDLFAPDASTAQRQSGLLAAQVVFSAAGLSPAAAGAAYFDHDESVSASPAQVRAARIWKHASDAAVRACYGPGAASALARLVVQGAQP